MKGLRPRLVATFAVVTAVTAGALAATSYLVVRGAVLDRAAESAVDEAQAAVAQVVASGQLPPGATPADARALIGRVASLGDAHVVAVGADGRFDSTSVSLSAASVPPSLAAALAGQPGRLSWVRTGTGRGDHVVVGAQLPDGPQLYLFFPLAKEVADLEVLRNVLAIAGAGLVLVSAAVGVTAASNLLRPLRRARVAAHRVEVGLLQTRLPEEGRDEFTDLARAFNRMADALERTLASHKRFVSDVSHELRTPLTALTTAADVLDNNSGGLNDPGRRAARLLVVESHRLASMVEDLMEISRFDAGVPSMAWEPVDLGRLVEGAVTTRGWADRVELDLPPGSAADAVTTWADPRRVDAVVANLIGNALEHGEPPVSVAVAAAPGAVQVVVTDGGPGIPAEHLARVFDRFYKADPSRSRGGSGLGLAIALENARLHGGDLSVVSDRGRGTRFTFALPRRTAAPEGATAPAPVAERLPAGDGAEITARHDVLVTKRRRGR